MTDEQITQVLRELSPKRVSPDFMSKTLSRFEALQERRRNRPKRILAASVALLVLLLGIGAKVMIDREQRLAALRSAAQRLAQQHALQQLAVQQRAAQQPAAQQPAGATHAEPHVATLSAAPRDHEAVSSEGDAAPRAAVAGHDSRGTVVHHGTVPHDAPSQPGKAATLGGAEQRRLDALQAERQRLAAVRAGNERDAALFAEWQRVSAEIQQLESPKPTNYQGPPVGVENPRIRLVNHGGPVKRPTDPSQAQKPPVMY